MDKTPKTKSAKYVRSSPVNEAKKKRFWNHDGDCSQESNDVLWDWDSPKNIKPKVVRIKKREIHKSPISAPKKTSQIDHIKNYERLKQELQALREEIASTDDCVPLSPFDEQIFKEENENSEINHFIEEQYSHIENQELDAEEKQSNHQCLNETVNELLNDGCDEQLFICTQVIEEKLGMFNDHIKKDCNTNWNYSMIDDHTKKNVYNTKKLSVSPPKKKTNNFVNTLEKLHSRSVDDSFDAVLLEFQDDDIELLSQANNQITLPHKIQNKTINSSFKRTVSDANVQYTSNLSEKSKCMKSDFHRTQSFDSAPVVKNDEDLPAHVIEEIERKRKEALARLLEKRDKDKKLSNIPANSISNRTKITCSPDEIEKKRLQAKAIREAKQKEIIERNRLEAVKRLEFNKRKRLENSKTHEKSFNPL